MYKSLCLRQIRKYATLMLGRGKTVVMQRNRWYTPNFTVHELAPVLQDDDDSRTVVTCAWPGQSANLFAIVGRNPAEVLGAWEEMTLKVYHSYANLLPDTGIGWHRYLVAETRRVALAFALVHNCQATWSEAFENWLRGGEFPHHRFQPQRKPKPNVDFS